MEPESGTPFTFYDPAAIAFDTETVIALLADLQIRRAIERGEFDNLPGSGKPLDLPDVHDPDWWFKNLVKREGLVLLPPSVQLRRDDAALDAELDALGNEAAVRRAVEQFNESVIRARYEPPAGPPLITMPRDVEATVRAWTDRRTARAEQARRKAEGVTRSTERTRRGWWCRRPRASSRGVQ